LLSPSYSAGTRYSSAILKARGDSPCTTYRLHCTTLKVSAVIGAEENVQKEKYRKGKTLKNRRTKWREK
jgi:hypothetical protein